MKNSDFNYKFQYEIYHQDNEQSRSNDINDAKKFLNDHNVLHVQKNAKILEIGSGMGRLLLALKSFGYNNSLGIDIDKSQHEVAKKDKLNVKLVDAIDFLKKTNDIYDVIYCLDVVEHIEKDKLFSFFQLLFKHLSKTGFVVIRVPNAVSPCATWHRYMDFTHNISFTGNSINFLARNSGFISSVIRPEWKEEKRLRRIKSLWARLYKTAWGMKEPILTNNLVAVLFKDEKTYKDYLEKAPRIKNRYWRI